MSDMDLATALLQLEQVRVENVELHAKVQRLEHEVAALRQLAPEMQRAPARPPAKARPRDSKATT